MDICVGGNRVIIISLGLPARRNSLTSTSYPCNGVQGPALTQPVIAEVLLLSNVSGLNKQLYSTCVYCRLDTTDLLTTHIAAEIDKRLIFLLRL